MKTNCNHLALLSNNLSKNKMLTKSILSAAILLALSPSVYADDKTAKCDSGGSCSPILRNVNGVEKSLAPPLDSSGNTKSTTDNTVTVEGAPTTGINDVFGAFHKAQAVNNNTVTISGGTITEDVYGGKSKEDIAVENSVTIGNGKVGGIAYGGYSEGKDVSKNSVTINSGDIKEGNAGFSIDGNAIGNMLTINGGSINGGSFIGGYSDYGSAIGNTVSINGGTVEPNVVGGFSGSGNATSNTVTISGGAVNKAVIGGFSAYGNATGNTVTIKSNGGNPTFGTNAILYGGFDGDPSTQNNVKTGNTLNLHTTGLTAKNIKNFENLRFYVQSDTQADETFLTLTDTADTDITGSKVGVGVEGNAKPLNVGDKVVLLQTTNGDLTTDTGNLTNTITGMQGIAVTYEFAIEKPDDQTLIAKATKAPARSGRI